MGILLKELYFNFSQIIAALWEMMAILLCTFPPNADFENYVEVFLRQKANPREKYLGALHKVCSSLSKILILDGL